MQATKTPSRLSAWWVTLFFIALTALGLAAGTGYGQPWDEPWEQDILRLNGNQYAAYLGIAVRMPTESDMPAPKSGLIEDSPERDHGQSAYYPLLWLVADGDMAPLLRMQLWHAYTWLWTMMGVGALWLIARRIGLSRVQSNIAALLLVLSPRMFAEGHYNNKDMVLLSLVLVTLWLALRLMEKPCVSRAMGFSLAGALAANTKIIGLLIWGLCGLVVLLRLAAARRMTGRAWVACGAALAAFIGCYALLTPALWGDPLGYLRYVLLSATDFTRWQNDVLFRGTVFSLRETPLPRVYLPYMILVTTPLWILLLIAIGQLTALRSLLRRPLSPLRDDLCATRLLCTLLWLFPFLFAVLGRPTIYNGWRHFYFLYAPLLVLGADGLQRVWLWLQAHPNRWALRLGAALLAICMGGTTALMSLSHARQYTYYNPLMLGKDLPIYMELDYWNVSVLETLRALVAQLPRGQRATVSGGEYWSQHGLEAALTLLPEDARLRIRLLPVNSGADYVLVNRTYAELGQWEAAEGMVCVVETQSYGNPLCSVYRRVSPTP